MAATQAPMHSYYLNFNMLDRYRKLGVVFLFNPATRQYHYSGRELEGNGRKIPGRSRSRRSKKTTRRSKSEDGKDGDEVIVCSAPKIIPGGATFKDHTLIKHASLHGA